MHSGYQSTAADSRRNNDQSSSMATASRVKSKRLRRRKAGSPLKFKANLWTCRSVPVLFVLICFLIIANTKCDKAGSTNGAASEKIKLTSESSNGSIGDLLREDKKAVGPTNRHQSYVKQASGIRHNSINMAMSKLDPLSMLREIYLDHNNKLITMLSPGGEGGDQVYNENNETNNDQQPLRAMLRRISRELDASNLVNAATTLAANKATGQQHRNSEPQNGPFYSNGAEVANLELEMSKLLKCNYTGLSNIYRCDLNNGGGVTND